jgi:2',3'-cyclic-nucleotide 2'-phosphodiesterase (5'-nucleotidase family)
MNRRRSLYDWLGLGVLALIVIGLLYLTNSNRPKSENADESPPTLETSPSSETQHLLAGTPSPSPLPLSPLPADLSSPLSADLNSPLPTRASPPPAVAPPDSGASFELTVLHTNDTWGYLLPCG